jgi:DNA-binding response OmpR family regulator
MSAEASSVQLLDQVLNEVVIDISGHEVRCDRRRIRLTRREFQLLSTLVAGRGRVFTRNELLGIWGDHPPFSPRTVDIHIARLRRKLGTPHDSVIETVRQVGYKSPLSAVRARIASASE